MVPSAVALWDSLPAWLRRVGFGLLAARNPGLGGTVEHRVAQPKMTPGQLLHREQVQPVGPLRGRERGRVEQRWSATATDHDTPANRHALEFVDV